MISGHTPVLVKEVIEMLNPTEGRTYIDATFGAGGYSRCILEKAKCKVIGIDCDKETELYSNKLKEKYQDRFTFVKENFKNIDLVLQELKIQKVDGLVFDLGVSSMQLDNRERGFSFLGDAPLDMRMDQENIINAKILLNKFSQKELADTIYHLSGERKSRIIAENITNYRRNQEIETTEQLVSAIGIKRYNGKIHFATRTFQALRICVNNELENLKIVLDKIPNILNTGGIVTAVTFHSLEDKIVKNVFKKLSADKEFLLVNKKVITPSYNEIKLNRRSRSAKLRVIQKTL